MLSALERGESDGILPAASAAMDRFAKLLDSSGILRVLGGFADYRSRASIPAFLFCNLLLHKAVFRLESLGRIGPFLFSSPDVLRMLGFHMRQIQDGFYSGSKERTLNVESLGDFFAACRLEDFQANQDEVVGLLAQRYPELFREMSLVMDCIDVRIPAGARGRGEAHLDRCVICLLTDGECLAILWSIVDGEMQADVTQGKAPMESLLSVVESGLCGIPIRPRRGLRVSEPSRVQVRTRAVRHVSMADDSRRCRGDARGATRDERPPGVCPRQAWDGKLGNAARFQRSPPSTIHGAQGWQVDGLPAGSVNRARMLGNSHRRS